MIAKVMIDIPVSQVNHPFDYLIPDDLKSLIRLGMRVEVPFGPRQLLGIVVGMEEANSSDDTPLKYVTRLMDLQSYLNDELITLSDYLAETLNAFRISILQTMLPSILKVNYQTFIHLNDQAKLNPGLVALAEDGWVEKDIFENYYSPSQIHQLMNDKVITINYLIKDKKRNKKIKKITTHLNTNEIAQAIENLHANAKQSKRLLTYIGDHRQSFPIDKQTFIEKSGFSKAMINKAIQFNWLSQYEEIVFRQPLATIHYEKSDPRELNSIQKKAYNQVMQAIDQEEHQVFLIEGVTGSGKTEVYLQLMAQVNKQGKSALLLVPEIALTPQMVTRVMGRFPEGVAVLHSGLSISEKFDEWQKIINGQATIVIGARSSIFAPLNNIGLIIIDEEHESTYKQSDNPRYHARDVALWRAQFHSCPLVLGSATPSLESRARAQKGNYQLIEMAERANASHLPEVELVDMTKVLASQTNHEISPQLLSAITQEIQDDHQVILLLNRRGYASYVQCRECGYVFQCKHCDISMTYHKTDQRLKCHYCDYQVPLPDTCIKCGSVYLRQQGTGTQKIEEALYQLIENAKIIRMDNDTTRKKGHHAKLLEAFNQKKGNILLGTQMIAKGLDFENVTLVGVINADTALNIPDFRAAEKTFQLLTQVAGRTGRGRYQGRVIIQTYNPSHYVMELSKSHDYATFFKYEMHRRHLSQYPPYFYMTSITVSSKSLSEALLTIQEIKNLLHRQIDHSQVIIVGPTQRPMNKIKERYYFQILLKYKNKQVIQKQMNDIVNQAQKLQTRGVYISIDHDPQQFVFG